MTDNLRDDRFGATLKNTHSERVAVLEEWRKQVDLVHSELKVTLTDIRNTLIELKLESAGTLAEKKAYRKTIALWSAIGGGSSVTGIELLSKILGV